VKRLRYIFACLLSVCLPLQNWAAMLPAPCHSSNAALVVSPDTVFQTQSVVPASSTQATHTQIKRHAHSDSHHTHSHPHKSPTSEKQSVTSWDTQAQAHSHQADVHAGEAVDRSSHHADNHVAGHDNCCKHGGSCCTGAVMLPTVIEVVSPSLAQTTLTWDAPLLLAVTPRTFDKPPKPLAV
jgi:hypothetical protein